MKIGDKINKLLNNDIVFAVAVLVAFLNVSGYIFVRSYECLAVFVAVACVSNYFSKNYVVDIIAAIFVANIVFGCGRIKHEGFQEGCDDNDQSDCMKNLEGMDASGNAVEGGAGGDKKEAKDKGAGGAEVPGGQVANPFDKLMSNLNAK